ncbi:MAG: flagellar biosynthesis anti-sigma factor FlgM [Bacteriovoracaceae bacterium]
MNNIEGASARSAFFPRSKQTGKADSSQKLEKLLKTRNNPERKQELDSMGSQNAKVNIDQKIKDFARIKKAVDAAPDVDNSAKIARLKGQIQNGTYKVDYDKLADKIIASEF